MGPVYTKCTGCHNEYGLGREQNKWTGALEGEPANAMGQDFFEQNLESMLTFAGIDGYDVNGSAVQYERDGAQEIVPYFLAKPAGLINPDDGTDMFEPYGHGGGRIWNPAQKISTSCGK